MSLLNGLSTLGAGVSAFAGTAGLEAQKAQLANQSAILADQLATTRETGLQGQQQTFQAGQNTQAQAAAASLQAQSEKAETGRTVLSGQIAATAAQKLQDFELAKTKLVASLPTPEAKEIMEYTGGAQPGSPEYQKGARDLALMKAGISPDLYGTNTPSAPTPPATGSTAPSGAPPPPTTATGASSTSTSDGTAYKPIAPGLDRGPPPGGYNESVLAGKLTWLVNKVHAINEGREEPPSSRSMNDPKSPEFIANALVNQYNPGFDATLYPARLEAQKAIAPGGSLFTSISAMNTSMGHVEHLGGLYDELANSAGGNWVNAPLNMVAANTGHYPVINEIRQTVQAMAEEGNRIYAGNSGTQTAIDAWKESFPLNGSLADQQGALRNFAQLMGAKFNTLASQVNAAAGFPGKPPVELLTPEAKAIYLKTIGQKPVSAPPGGGAPSSGAAAPAASGSDMTPQQMYGGSAPSGGATQPNRDLLRIWGQ